MIGVVVVVEGVIAVVVVGVVGVVVVVVVVVVGVVKPNEDLIVERAKPFKGSSRKLVFPENLFNQVLEPVFVARITLLVFS